MWWRASGATDRRATLRRVQDNAMQLLGLPRRFMKCDPRKRLLLDGARGGIVEETRRVYKNRRYGRGRPFGCLRNVEEAGLLFFLEYNFSPARIDSAQ